MLVFNIYYRVSTQKQGNSGLGLEAQQKSVNDYLAHLGAEYKIQEVFTEVESGKNNARPELQKALRNCQLSDSTLLVAKLDRLSRNKAFLFSLMESQTRLVCADMPEATEVTLSFMAVIAAYEGKIISQRTKAALAAAKARGVVLGNLPTLTNRCTKAATKARSEKAAVKRRKVMEVICEGDKENGPMSLRETARYLDERGVNPAQGSSWSSTGVKRVRDAMAEPFIKIKEYPTGVQQGAPKVLSESEFESLMREMREAHEHNKAVAASMDLSKT